MSFAINTTEKPIIYTNGKQPALGTPGEPIYLGQEETTHVQERLIPTDIINKIKKFKKENAVAELTDKEKELVAWRKKKKRRDRRRTFLIIAVFLIGGYLVSHYLITFVRVGGNTMFPSMHYGDLGVFYVREPYTLNEIVLYRTDDGERHIGRTIATGGQTITFPDETGGLFLIDGIQPSEKITYETRKDENSSIEYPLTVPEGSYFILNDFRYDTSDSRQFGCIKESRIEGRLIYLFRRRDF